MCGGPDEDVPHDEAFFLGRAPKGTLRWQARQGAALESWVPVSPHNVRSRMLRVAPSPLQFGCLRTCMSLARDSYCGNAIQFVLLIC